MALKILLADDSMTAQNMGKKILVDAGYDVVAVSNGAAAIKKIASERPDIAILDEYMPGYTGSEVCERVKAAAETAKMPVLLTVGKMEPFDQERANKARADGLMIKPFEASDLIAAVQGIAQKLLAPTPAPQGLNGTVHSGESRVASVPFSVGSDHEDTIRIEPPLPTSVSHDDTLRLTAEQIKAFQDASREEWSNTAEMEVERATAPKIEMPVTPAPEEVTAPDPAMPIEATAEQAAAMLIDVPRETPVFSAMNASGVAAEHEIFTVSATPVAAVETPADEAATAPVFYTPPELAPVFAVEPPAVVEPLTSVVEPEISAEAAAVVEPEIAPAAPIVVPAMEAVPAAPAAPEAIELETNAPLTPGPVPVEPAAEFEPTVASPIQVEAIPADELEINSPPQERGAVIAADPSLVTDSEDISQFTTRFGVEGAQPEHVGVVAYLPQEQQAAMLTPLQQPAAVTQEIPEPAAPVSLNAEVEPSAIIEPEIPVAAVPIVEPAHVEPESASVVVPEERVAASPIEREIGAIEAVEPFETEEPVVAYVPGYDETARMVPYSAPEPEALEPQVLPVEPVVSQPIPSIETPSEPEVAVSGEHAAPVQELDRADAAGAVESAVVELPQAEPAEGIASVTEPEKVKQAVHAEITNELTAAAAAAAVGSGQCYPATLAEAPVMHHQPEAQPESAVEPIEAKPGTDSAAALAEELAVALSRKESEERNTAAEAVSAVALHAPTAASELAHSLSDDRLADAVARAFENLKPQLIAEIIKQIEK